MGEFKLPPVSPLGGTTFSSFLKVLKGHRIAPRYYLIVAITTVLILFCSIFHWLDRIYFKKKQKNTSLPEPPLFILGHWRSGTTLLHNLLTQDPAAAYVSTFNAVFPNNLRSQRIFRPLMKAFMPEVRPGDNVKLAVQFPQEDEYAISNLTHRSYYHVFYFPTWYKKYYREHVRFESVPDSKVEAWKQLYKDMVTRAMLNTGGRRMILKNPVNTGRLPQLTEVFPDARYIHIIRNPITVYMSSKKFFSQLYPTVNLEPFTEEEIGEMVLEIYAELLKDYLADARLIPKENILEIRYESFEQEPMKYLKKIYDTFGYPGFTEISAVFGKYLESQKGHKMHRYKIKQSELNHVLYKLDFAMKLWKYEIPSDLIITDIPNAQGA